MATSFLRAFANGKNVFAVLLLLIASFPLFPRDITIFVEDSELSLPLEGAVILSWDGTQHTCDAEGKTVITAPDDRQVVIHAAYPGYENGRLAINPDQNRCTLGLRLSGIMENRELVIEASRPGTGETKTGRSVAVSGREITQTAEIGIIEDVMSSIKLLPGVGYAGFFNAQPSIRGGDPGDMKASFDGYYIMNPYHWNGGYSIFDPHMVQSAQLSHGVFSSRHSHTISGLLDITPKKPSPVETEFEFGLSTSMASFNLSFPLSGKGGILFMGRLTYYDPVIWFAKQLSRTIEMLEIVNSIRVAPYIRSGAVTGNYRFTGDLELNATAFWGMDGVGASFYNGPTVTPDLTSSSSTVIDWTNYQGFITAGLTWNPVSDMLFKFTAGTGYEDAVVDGAMSTDISEKYFSNTFFDTFKNIYSIPDEYLSEKYQLSVKEVIKESDIMYNIQGRIDYDWEMGHGFLLAAGIQEMYTRFIMKGDQLARREKWLGYYDDSDKILDDILANIGMENAPDEFRKFLKQNMVVSNSIAYSPDSGNRLFATSGYALVEYATPDSRLGIEAGLRIDHYFLLAKDFSIQAMPAFNPRLNLDYNVFKNKWIIESLDVSAGTGLFSAMNNNIFMAEKKHNVTEIKSNRSWTSVLGARIEFNEGISFNIEGYYKEIFDRMYIPVTIGIGEDDMQFDPRSDGVGRAWGIDLILQKLQSRFWDGWVTYSFSWAKYREPGNINADMNIGGGNRGDAWYFPYHHRFHNLNLIVNIKPAPSFNIYTRFGFASGTQQLTRIIDSPISYPVYDLPSGQLIEKYYWPSKWDEDNRSTPTLPLDIKFSIFGRNKTGRTRYEVYAAIENLLILVYYSQGNSSYNSYTGRVDAGSNAANFEIPIPISSFGVKFSY